MQRLALKRETVIAREAPMSLHATCRKLARVIAVLAAFGLALSIAPQGALGFERYNDGCQSCHGNFTSGGYSSRASGVAWPSSLHTVHRSSSYMNTECNSTSEDWNDDGQGLDNDSDLTRDGADPACQAGFVFHDGFVSGDGSGWGATLPSH